MKSISRSIWILAALLTTSCITNREVLEGQLNWNIGKPFSRAWPHVPPEEKVKGSEGSSEYKVRLSNNCLIMFFVDEKGITTGWRYVSDPSRCQANFSFRP
jgi:hypothetical protein